MKKRNKKYIPRTALIPDLISKKISMDEDHANKVSINWLGMIRAFINDPTIELYNEVIYRVSVYGEYFKERRNNKPLKDCKDPVAIAYVSSVLTLKSIITKAEKRNKEFNLNNTKLTEPVNIFTISDTDKELLMCNFITMEKEIRTLSPMYLRVYEISAKMRKDESLKGLQYV